MRKSIYLSGFLLCTFLMTGVERAYAQDVAFTQYYLNLAGINPAFTGIEDFADTKVAFRQGWNDFGVKNNNLFASLYAPIGAGKALSLRKNSLRVSNVPVYEKAQSAKNLRRRQGIGGMMTRREVGPYTSTNASLNYSYHIPITSDLSLAMGVKATYGNQTINFSGYTLRDDVNDAFYNQLKAMGQGNLNAASLDFGGVLYSSRFYLGVSSANLAQRATKGTGLWTDANKRQYILQTAYSIPLGATVIWNTGVRVTDLDGYNLSWSVNSRLRYKQFIYIGSAYDSVNKLSFLFGISADGNFSLNYSYDHYLTNAGSLNVSVHELILGIGLFNKYKSSPRLW